MTKAHRVTGDDPGAPHLFLRLNERVTPINATLYADDPDNYIVPQNGVIQHAPYGQFEACRQAGLVNACQINFGDMLNAGVDPDAILSACNNTDLWRFRDDVCRGSISYRSPFFNRSTEIAAGSNTLCGNVLLVRNITLSPPYRGQGWGFLAYLTLLQQLSATSGSFDAVLSDNTAARRNLHPDAHEYHDWHERVGANGAERVATQEFIEYLQTLGLEPIEGAGYSVFPTCKPLPTVSDMDREQAGSNGQVGALPETALEPNMAGEPTIDEELSDG